MLNNNINNNFCSGFFFKKNNNDQDKDIGLNQRRGVFFDDITIPFDTDIINNSVIGWVNNDFDDPEFKKFNSSKHEKESYYKKILSNRWDIITDWSIKSGNHHFAITINLPEVYFNEKNLSNYDSYDESDYNKFIFNIRDVLLSFFKTITFFYVVGEKNKKNNLHFHLLIGIRNFIDYNYCLRDNLANVLKINLGLFRVVNMCDYDIKVQPLNYFRDVKNWAIYLHKDMYIWKYPAYIFCIENYIETVFVENLGNIIYLYLLLNLNLCPIDKSYTSIKDFQLGELLGVTLRDNLINQGVLINLLQYYLILKNYFIFNESIYKKIDGSVLSYEYINTLEDELYNGFQENIIMFYTVNFEYYFKGFDFNYLLRVFFIKSKNIINSIKDITTNKIHPDFSIIEFKDGLYFILYDRFISKKLFKRPIKNISTLKYYGDKNYNWVRKNEPKNWINGLLKSLDINTMDRSIYKNNDHFKLICLYLANIFHKNIFIKKLTLYIFGESNTRKTTLIVLPLSNYFGEENIGRIVSTKNFKLQGLEGKVVGVLDEFKYNSYNSGDFLKLLAGESLIVEKKYSKEHVLIDNISIIIISNNLIKDKDEKINEALYNRISFIEFFNPVKNDTLNNSKYLEKIKEEEANIIIYCNKMYFNKRDENKKLSCRISNEKILEKILK